MITFENNIFHLQGGNVSYIFGIKNGKLLHLYWGRAIEGKGLEYMLDEPRRGGNPDLDTDLYDFSTYGSGDYREPVCEAKYQDGSSVVVFTYSGYEILNGKPKIEGLPATYANEDEAQTLVIKLEDKLTGLCAKLYYTIFLETGALTRSVVYQNNGTAPIVLERALSMCVDFERSDYDLINLYGAWGKERMLERLPLRHGIQGADSKRGMSSHNQNPFIALLDKDANEFKGDVYGFNLVYSGNFTAIADVDNYECTRVLLGINHFDFSWLLECKEEFHTPEAVLVYSPDGLNGMSHKFHTLYRENLTRGKYKKALRPIVVNNWEATYFDFTEDKIVELAKTAKELGIEMVVLDDGWFGHRNDDTSSLGDWYINKSKLPNGLKPLVDRVRAEGVEFGLWFEPEMISPDSDLYRAHPDWCIHVQGRARTEGRNQLTLDLSRKDVCDYIIDTVSNILASCDISYVKWDMNRSMTEIGSALLPANRQRELTHRYMLGLYRVLEEITSRFPDILFEGCASGGGRFDPGYMYYMPQSWTSDNSDAIERLFIQYGSTLSYPPSSMDCNVSAVPNHQCGRVTPLKTRGDVAMAGVFGYQLDITRFTPEEKEEVKKQVKLYKEIRETVQYGTYTRLMSPFDGNYAAWQTVSQDGKNIVATMCKILFRVNSGTVVRLRLEGLDRNANYRDMETGAIYNGGTLMEIGLLPRFGFGDYQTMMWRLERI